MSEKPEMDLEWVELMSQAKEIGLEPDEVRRFLQESQKEKKEISV